MPYVRFVTSEKLDEEKREAVRNSIWDAITVLPRKTPEVTMVEINDNADLMKGPGAQPAIFTETRVFTAAPFADKDTYVRKLTESLHKLTGVADDQMYFNILEFNEWGGSGKFSKF